MKNVFHSVLRFIVIVTILSFPGYLLAQHTTVTAQVKDPTNQLYRTCTGSANFIGQNTVPGAGPYTLGGGTFQTVVPINCDGSARFTISLADNNVITPTPSQWQFAICTAIGVYTGPVICFTGLITITGATQDITAALQAISAPLPPYSAILETNGVPNGSQSLLNLIAGTNITIVDNGVGGVTISSTGGGGGGGGCTPAGGTGALQVNNGSGGCVGVNGVATGSALVSNGVGTAPVFQAKAIVDVRDYTGADWCAQVNAADTAFAGLVANLNVPYEMSGMTACTTQISLRSNHSLQFGAGSFDMGTLTSRAGIVIGHAITNVDLGGAGRSVTSVYFTSANVGAGNSYPFGSAVALGSNVGCNTIADAANNIRIHDIHFIDRNAGSALGPAFNPSTITGICNNNIIIENNQLTDSKGNAAITLTGSWNTFTTASGYMDRNNIFDGTTGGGGGEFTADNSANWTNFSMMNNIISDYPCGIGVSHGFNGIITGNTIDLTLKAKFGNCPGIALGSSDDTVGDLQATNNIITMGSNSVASAVIGMGFFPKAAATGSTEMVISGNIIREVANGVSGPSAAVSINGTNVGQNPPTMIVRHNATTTSYAVLASGNQVSDIEVSDNDFGPNPTDHGNVPLFNCPGGSTPAVLSGKAIRVFNNRYAGTNPGGVADSCTNASFSTRQFQEWGNTIGDGNPSTSFAASGFLGKATRLLWTPGTVAAYSSTSNQVVTVTQVIAGDSTRIINASGATLLSLPAGVISSGVVTSANTVTFNITNTTAAPVSINGGLQIASYVVVDRPPNNAQPPAYTLNNSITLGASPNTSAQIGPVTARTGAFNGTPSVIIQEEAGNNPLEIHTTHQTGIDLYSHDATSGLRGPALDFLRSRGTQAAPAAVLNGDLFAVLNIGAYDGTGYFAPQIIGYGATENWNATSHGLGAAFAVIPNGTTAPTNAMVLNNNATVTFPNAVTASSYTASGVNGGLSATEGTGAGVPPGAGLDVVWADSTAHRFLMNNNNEATSERVAGTYASGNVTTAGTVVNAGTCQAQTGITITGALTTDNVVANIGAVLPATWQTGIVLSAHVTAGNTVTVYLCNPSAGNITPAATQVNVRILR